MNGATPEATNRLYAFEAEHRRKNGEEFVRVEDLKQTDAPAALSLFNKYRSAADVREVALLAMRVDACELSAIDAVKQAAIIGANSAKRSS